MARYQQGNFGFKTLVEFDELNPIKNLWRNVLIVAIEDAIKIKSTTLKFSNFFIWATESKSLSFCIFLNLGSSIISSPCDLHCGHWCMVSV